MQKKKKISAQERDQIAVLLASGLSLRKIAKELSRSVSSVSDEVKRNSTGGEYKSIAANSLSLQRNRQSRKINPLKDPKIFSYVFDKLREGWSLEQIAGRLKRLNKGVGLKKLAEYLGWTLENTMSIGNGPNDRELVEMAGIGVTTDPDDLNTGSFYTTKVLDLGGEELVDKLLELM